MRVTYALAVLPLVHAALFFAERPSAFTNQSKPKTAHVTMLAVSSSSRQSFAGNREIYLADLQSGRGEHQFVRLVDQYPGYGLPIRDTLLKSRTLFSMKVTREPECDVTGAQIPLASSDRVIFNAAVRDALATHQSDLVPCYRTLHSTIRIQKIK